MSLAFMDAAVKRPAKNIALYKRPILDSITLHHSGVSSPGVPSKLYRLVFIRKLAYYFGF